MPAAYTASTRRSQAINVPLDTRKNAVLPLTAGSWAAPGWKASPERCVYGFKSGKHIQITGLDK